MKKKMSGGFRFDYYFFNVNTVTFKFNMSLDLYLGCYCKWLDFLFTLRVVLSKKRRIS